MDAFNFDNLKTEKANAMLRYRRLRNVAKLFRLLELCLGLVFLSWTSSRLPFLLKISGDYFRQIVALIISPLFIFLLSNLIVLTLLAKSGQLMGQSSSLTKTETNLYEEFTKNIENSISLQPTNCPPAPEEIVYQDKQIISEVSTLTNELTLVSDQKVFRRSQSENLNLKTEISEKPCGKLRRSETEICRKTERSGEYSAEMVEVEVVDELSNEEFNRTIEAFIAKQLRFHKEEKLAIVVPGPTHGYS